MKQQILEFFIALSLASCTRDRVPELSEHAKEFLRSAEASDSASLRILADSLGFSRAVDFKRLEPGVLRSAAARSIVEYSYSDGDLGVVELVVPCDEPVIVQLNFRRVQEVWLVGYVTITSHDATPMPQCPGDGILTNG
jgi:hypothetical protein